MEGTGKYAQTVSGAQPAFYPTGTEGTNTEGKDALGT